MRYRPGARVRCCAVDSYKVLELDAVYTVARAGIELGFKRKEPVKFIELVDHPKLFFAEWRFDPA